MTEDEIAAEAQRLVDMEMAQAAAQQRPPQ
jgi:hypothetical protein